MNETLEANETLGTQHLLEQANTLANELEIDPGLWNDLMALSEPLRLHHEPTFQHSLRVGIMAAALARQINPDDVDTQRLALMGGVAHDLGKINTDPLYLNDDRSLSQQEYEDYVKPHSRWGYEHVGANERLSAVAIIAGLHHCCETPEDRSYKVSLPESTHASFVQYLEKISIIISSADHVDASFRENGRWESENTKQAWLVADMKHHHGSDYEAALETLLAIRAQLVKSPAICAAA